MATLNRWNARTDALNKQRETGLLAVDPSEVADHIFPTMNAYLASCIVCYTIIMFITLSVCNLICVCICVYVCMCMCVYVCVCECMCACLDILAVY